MNQHGVAEVCVRSISCAQLEIELLPPVLLRPFGSFVEPLSNVMTSTHMVIFKKPTWSSFKHVQVS